MSRPTTNTSHIPHQVLVGAHDWPTAQSFDWLHDELFTRRVPNMHAGIIANEALENEAVHFNQALPS